MPIEYKIYQNTNQKSDVYQKWFARPALKKAVSTRQLADKIQQNVSVKASDVYAVLMELPNAIREIFSGGSPVILEGLGSFRPSFGCSPSDSPNDVTALKLRKKRIVFTPESTQTDVNLTRTVGDKVVNIQTRVRSKKLLEGIEYVENDSYQSPRVKPDTAGSGAGTDTTNP